MTTHVSLTGTDGTGKTTIVRALAARFRDRPDALVAFRAPQYHEEADAPFGALSLAVETLGQLGDRLGDPLLKASALFLSMTLYGDVERHMASTYTPRVVVGERQPLADSLVFARFYHPLLTRELDRDKLEPLVLEAIGEEGLARLDGWLRVIGARWPERPVGSFWALPVWIHSLFDAPGAELLTRLRALYRVTVPDVVVQLTLTPEAANTRLALKGAGQTPQELHEQAHVQAMFQAGLRESLAMLGQISPGLRISEIDTSTQTIAETEKAVLAAIGGFDS